MDDLKKTILLVDDDPLINRMYQVKLSEDGYNVEIAANGEEALIKARKHKPDLILLDLMMPKMNGIEALKELKKDETTKNIKIIILTNLEDKEGNLEKAKEMGALDYLIKAETDLKVLSEKVKVVLGNK
ncbi:MAG: response regulator [Candidatus Taylorbacteria bacterium]|nr:response regulator [Candidatus Taylorbacteria bacterium]